MSVDDLSCNYWRTSREWPKPAPLLRLKNSKRTSKCQVLLSTVSEKPKSWTKLALPCDILLSILLQNIRKIEGGPFEDKAQNVVLAVLASLVE